MVLTPALVYVLAHGYRGEGHTGTTSGLIRVDVDTCRKTRFTLLFIRNMIMSVIGVILFWRQNVMSPLLSMYWVRSLFV